MRGGEGGWREQLRMMGIESSIWSSGSNRFVGGDAVHVGMVKFEGGWEDDRMSMRIELEGMRVEDGT